MKMTNRIGLMMSLLALSTGASLATTLVTQFGVATGTDGLTPVPDGTLWVLIVDTNNSGTLPQLNLNSGITSSGAAFDNSPFWYANLSVGTTIVGDKIIAMGGFNNAGAGVTGATANTISGLDYAVMGLAQNQQIGFYWFPGVNYAPATTTYAVAHGLGSSVGGINSSVIEAGADSGMLLPADGATVNIGANTSGDLGGSLPTSSFQAVTIIPEASTALLGALGALGLLRRRR